jgi:hypothetical protein
MSIAKSSPIFRESICHDGVLGNGPAKLPARWLNALEDGEKGALACRAARRSTTIVTLRPAASWLDGPGDGTDLTLFGEREEQSPASCSWARGAQHGLRAPGVCAKHEGGRWGARVSPGGRGPVTPAFAWRGVELPRVSLAGVLLLVLRGHSTRPPLAGRWAADH